MSMSINGANYPTQSSYGIKNNRKQDVSFGAIYKAFVIEGGTKAARKAKSCELSGQDSAGMVVNIVSACGNRLGKIFCDNPRDRNVTFEDIERLAGTKQLGRDFHTSTFGQEPNAGIINLDG